VCEFVYYTAVKLQTWLAKKENELAVQRTEMRMMRCIC